MFIIDDINFKLIRVKQGTKQPLYDQLETSIENTYPDVSLIVPKNIIVVDADDEKIANVLFNLYGSKTHWVKTSRGYHFYFKLNPKNIYFSRNFEANRFSSKRYCLLGFKVDYKKNLPDFNNGVEHLEAVKVKSDGVIRESSNDTIIELPLELYPLFKNVEQDKDDLFDIIGLADNRNSTLISIIGTLINCTKKYNYNTDLIEQTIRIINDYIFREPLPSKELDSLISRIGHYSKKNNDNIDRNVKYNNIEYSQNSKVLENINIATNDDGTINDFNRFEEHKDVLDKMYSIVTKSDEATDMVVQYLTKNYILIRYQDTLYIKDDNIDNVKFENCENPVDMGVFLESIGLYVLNKSRVQDIIFKCKIKARHVKDDEMSVIFKNGYVLDQETGNVSKYNNEFSNIVVDTDYHPPKKAHEISKDEMYYRNMVDNFISFVADGGVDESFYVRDPKNPNIHDNGEYARKEVENVLDQILGHTLMTTRLPHYAYFFTGNSGANGKSTLFNIIKALIGDNNTTAISLDQLNENEYYRSTMTKSLVNIGDDIDDSFIESSTIFKTIVTNNPISVRVIKESPFETRLFSTLLYNCNKMPRFKDNSGGIERRLKIIPMLKQVPENKRRNDLELILTHPYAKQRLLERALDGFKKLRQNNCIIKFGRIIEMESEKYFLLIDTFRGFLYEEIFKDNELRNASMDYSEKIKTISNRWVELKLKDVYGKYLEFCTNDGRKYPLNKNSFRQRLEKDCNLSFIYNEDDWVIKTREDSVYNL